MSLIFIPKLPSVSFTTDKIVSNVRVVTLSAEHLQPVVPSRGDKVKVILGDEDKDQTGQLLSIDSQVLIVVINLYPSSASFLLVQGCGARAAFFALTSAPTMN